MLFVLGVDVSAVSMVVGVIGLVRLGGVGLIV